MSTAYMNLTLPTVTVTQGPEWASQLNTALETIDSHDHSSGKGTKVTPAGLNINANLEFNDNNLTEVKSVRYQSQASALNGVNDIRCVYVAGNDLYYNNEAGTAVQITSGSGLNAASLGGIGGDYASSSASVSYSNASKKFTFTQTTNTSAHLDIGDLTIREDVASANGITIQSPASLGSSYSLTLPSALPGTGTKILTLDSTGQISAQYDVDDSTIQVSSNTIQVKDSGITTAKINNNAVTRAKLASVGQQISSSSGNYSTTVVDYNDITNLSVTITTTGRPVWIGLQPASGTSFCSIGANVSSSGALGGNIKFVRDSTDIAFFYFAMTNTASSIDFINIPPSSFWFVDTPAAGTYTYKVQGGPDSGTFTAIRTQLVVFEL